MQFYNFGITSSRFDIIRKILMIVKVEISYKEPPQDIRYPWKLYQFVLCLYSLFQTLFQPQNDLKYEVFHDMFAPTIRIKLDVEI